MSLYKLIILNLVGILLLSCKHKPFTTVEIQNLAQDSILSVRALDFNDDYVFYGSKDHFGKIALNREFKIDPAELSYSKGFNHKKYVFKKNDGTPLGFRAIEQVNGDMYALSIESPARLYKLKRKAEQANLVYEELHPNAFYDALLFWNDQEGIAIGDPIEGCISIIITRDGGETWQKIKCVQLPKAKDGEAAFAASDTNIAIFENKTWIVTGGMASRVLFSPNKGKSWEVFETPIVQGEPTTGMYSIDFYDELQGFAIGGDYTKPDENQNNKIYTKDGGKTWQVIAQGKGPGYRSCVQYIPNSNAMELVAVGFKGIDYSKDGGVTWIHLRDEPFYTIRFINETEAFAAGNGRISKLKFK
jgi:photosystem II stability/assembly factor-like uncharacterized protein